MNNETRARMKENHEVDRCEINVFIEMEETEALLERIRFYAEMTELMARALVNKTKE